MPSISQSSTCPHLSHRSHLVPSSISQSSTCPHLSHRSHSNSVKTSSISQSRTYQHLSHRLRAIRVARGAGCDHRTRCRPFLLVFSCFLEPRKWAARWSQWLDTVAVYYPSPIECNNPYRSRHLLRGEMCMEQRLLAPLWTGPPQVAVGPGFRVLLHSQQPRTVANLCHAVRNHLCQLHDRLTPEQAPAAPSSWPSKTTVGRASSLV